MIANLHISCYHELIPNSPKFFILSLEHYLPSLPPTVCDVFKAAAIDTWHRIQFSRSTPRMKILETTVTQNIVYEMRLLKDRYPALDYKLFESTDERANGDDLELSVVQFDNKEITYAIQSKIIYHRRGKYGVKLHEGYYSRLNHLVGKPPLQQKQVKLLLDYADANNFVPLYMFYNYVMGSRLAPAEIYGCSIISAEYLKKNHTAAHGNLDEKTKFSQLHPSAAFPWHELVCSFINLTKDEILKKLSIETGGEIRTHRPAELMGNGWTEIELIPDTPNIEEQKGILITERSFDLEQYDNNKIQEQPPVFSPKFKIVINTLK